MIFATGFIILIIGHLMCEWNSKRPYTWLDRWLPRARLAGLVLMTGSVTAWLATFLP